MPLPQDVAGLRCSGHPAYDAAHMEHFMFLLAVHVQLCARRMVASVPVFEGPFDQVHPVVEGAYTAVLQLERVYAGLSSYFSSVVDGWGSPSRLTDSPKLALVARLRQRALEVLQVREVLQEVSMLTGTPIPPGEALAAFRPLAASCMSPPAGPDHDPLWAAARRDFDQRLGPYEGQLRSQLRSLLSELYAPALGALDDPSSGGGAGGRMQPQEVVRELAGLRHVLARPGVVSQLQDEVGGILRGLSAYLGNVQADWQRRVRAGGDSPVDALCVTAQAAARVGQVQAVAAGLAPALRVDGSGLGDECAGLAGSAAAAAKEARSAQEGALAAWTESTRARLSQLKMHGFKQLMDLDGEGRLRTAFSQEMLGLLKQARQVAALGLRVPRDVSQGLDLVRGVTRRGMALMQVVNFYNEVSTSIADCHKKLLVEEAKRFEKVIFEPTDASGNTLSWDNTAGLDSYLRKLSEKMGEFKSRHERILHFHRHLEGVVRGLMDADLAANPGRWDSAVKSMMVVFRNLEADFDAKSQQNWRLHWDMQLKKVLALLWRRGLETYHRSQPKQEVRLVFQQRRLAFDPPLEHIRQEYVRGLSAFASLPSTAGGVSAYAKEGTGFFASVADGPQSAALVAAAYEQSEKIFTELSNQQKNLADWTAVGAVANMEAFVDEVCADAAQIKPNLQLVSQVQREAAKFIPAQVERGPFTVILAGVRDAVERQCKQLQEAIIASLSRRAREELLEIEGMLSRGKELLSVDVSSIAELGARRKLGPELEDASGKIKAMIANVQARNRLMAEISQSSGMRMEQVELGDLEGQADDFESHRQRHEHDLEDQRKKIVGQLETRKREFNDRIQALRAAWAAEKPKAGATVDSKKVFKALDEMSERAEALRTEAKELDEDCAAGDIEGVDVPSIDDLANDVEAERNQWQNYDQFCSDRDALFKTPWMGVRERARNELEDFLYKWKKELQGRVGQFGIVERTIQGDLERYEAIMPHLQYIQGFSWDESHWARLFKLLGMPPRMDMSRVTLLDFLERTDRLAQVADEIRIMDARAQAESSLRKAIAELNDWGFSRAFALTEQEAVGSGKAVSLIKEWKDLMTEVGDHQSLVSSLKQNQFFADSGIADSALGWEKRLGELSVSLLELNDIQRRWVYLEPIFSRGALPSEQGRFGKVDREFQTLMAGITRDPNVKSFADRAGLGSSLKAMATQLEHCQKALLEFLEERRSVFPRFYFIGDDDLLAILSQSKKPEVIQSRLKKLFAGIFSVVLESGQISHMCSSDGEQVALSKAVTTTDQVEAWLGDLEKGMRQTLQARLTHTTQEKGGGGLRGQLSIDDFEANPSQVLCLSEMIRFTSKAEAAIQSNGVAALRQEIQGNLAQYTQADYEGQSVMQLKVKALVLDTIHHLDILDRLEEARVGSPNDWDWNKQLRFYFKPGGLCEVQMASSKLDYTFEYQGNAPKLVYTPLTDKCFLTLTQAIRLGYGGNPYGPAGTGKTESVKALGQYLGRQVLVFNCDEEFDFKSMGRIFMGLLKCGAWGCFDEFNRLEPEVLSAVSQQIQSIQSALKQGQREMNFMARNVPVDKNAGIFVTLNPAGKGYGGRSQLPDNLKQLFRSVAMTVPDNELIAEVMLLAEGFRHAKFLARRIVTLFEVSKQQLSRQIHYDWGLRSLKTILGIAGKLLRDARSGRDDELGQNDEAAVAIQAIRATKVPTLTGPDAGRFGSLIACQFQGVQVEDAEDKEIQGAIRGVMEDMGLVHDDDQLQKIEQLELATRQRIGVIIVGPSGSGKSTLWQVLEGAYAKLGRKLRIHKMNPKAIDRKQLLGSLDLDTREWTDGVLTSAARRVVAEEPGTRSWIICDGDVDPEWIESLNSVLDDNRLLTLPNGERIQFGSDNVNFIFECHSLQFASPATVSRCGMIFISEVARDIAKDVRKWVADLERSGMDVTNLSQWSKELLPKILAEAGRYDSAVTTTTIGRLRCGLTHLRDPANKAEFARDFAAGIAANMTPAARAKFLQAAAQKVGEPSVAQPTVPPTIAEAMQAEDDFGDSPSSLVPTQSVLTQAGLLAPWLGRGDPVVVVGPEGCGKSLLLTSLCSMLPGQVKIATLACSSSTGANAVIAKLKQLCGKPKVRGSGKVLSPIGASRVVLLIKDIDLPRADKYGTVQLVAFLQQLITYHGFYDEDEGLEFVQLENVQLACTMTPQGSVGRTALSTRLTANMRVSFLDTPPEDELREIFGQLMKPVADHIRQIGSGSVSPSQLADAVVSAYAGAADAFSANDHRHYALSPRVLSTWAAGLLQYGMQDAALVPDAVLYEGQRVLLDRMVSDSDRGGMGSILTGAVRSAMRADVKPGPVFTLAGEALGRNSVLQHVSLSDYKEIVSDKLRVFAREEMEAPLVLFPTFLRRLAAIERALVRSGGNVLLVGESGAGRRTSALLAAHMLRMHVVSPRMVKGYSDKHFAADLVAALESAGTRDQPTLLLVDDHQLTQASFLETLNSWLMAGEVLGILSKEDRERMMGPLEDDPARGEHGGAEGLFYHRARQNLRVCVCADHTGPDFARRCEANPGLFGRCTLVWMPDWGEEGSRSVAENLLEDAVKPNEREHIISQALMLCSASAAASGEESAPPAAPRKVDAVLRSFVSVLGRKRTEMTEQLGHLKLGMGKLAEASETVDQLSVEAEAQKVKLAAAQDEAARAMSKITETMEDANRRKMEVEKLSQQLAIDEVEIQRQKGGVEAELAEVQPKIDQARQAVGSIKKEHLAEIKSMKAPPEPIRDVLEAVMKLMGQTDTTWGSMRNFLGQTGFKERVVNFDASTISDAMHRDVSALTAKRSASFDPKKIGYVSQAAAPLAAWTVANLMYSKVLQMVAPLTDQLSVLAGKHDRAMAEKERAQAEITTLEGSISELQVAYSEKVGQAEQLKIGLKRAEDTLSRAQGLLGALTGEQSRWEQTAAQMEQDMDALPGNALLAAAFCVFLPGRPEDVRADCMSQWAQVVGEPGGWSFSRFMSTERQVLGWKAEGLPGDQLSTENAIAILNSQQAPFIIDPSQHAAAWLEAHLRAKGGAVKVTAPHAKNFVNSLELAVRFGEALVVKDMDHMEPILVPLLRGDRYKQGPRSVVLVGDKLIDFAPSFQLFMFTRNPTPALGPQARALVSEVNFSVTRAGLEAQLLGLTIAHEKPELEKQLKHLLREEEDLKMQLSDLERSLLDTLATSTGNILENESLTRTLNDTKHKAQVVEDSLRESSLAQERLAEERSGYAPVAGLGSSVFFAIRDLRSVNHVYQISLPAFLALFQRVLVEDETDPEAREARVASLQERLVRQAYTFVSRGLFNQDRLTFAMHLARVLSRRKADARAGAVLSRSLSKRGGSQRLFALDSEWDVLLQRAPPTTAAHTVEVPSWVREEARGGYRYCVAHLPSLVATYRLADAGVWAAWSSAPAPEEHWPEVPGVSWAQTGLHQVLLTQALRPDRLQPMMSRFACRTMGVPSTEPPPVPLRDLVSGETRADEPVLFLTTPGADPSQDLADLAKAAVGQGNFVEVAMGQGQAEIALRLLRECAEGGRWLCLKNLHLVVSWLPELEKEIFSLTPHESFRLFLTSEPHDGFPSSLLEHSLKLTFEAPPGIRNNLLRTVGGWQQGGAVVTQGETLKGRLLFALAWFHAVLQERRRYIPIGWCKFYDFSGADLRSGADIIDSLVGATSEVEWPGLIGLLETAVYGGKIDNDPDFSILREYLGLLFCDSTVGSHGAQARPLPGTERLSVPSSGQLSDMAQVVASLPENDPPELFSLPANVQRTAQQQRSMHVLQQMRTMDVTKELAAAVNLDEWRHKLSVLIKAWGELVRADPALQEMAAGRARHAPPEGAAPMQSMLALAHSNAAALVAQIGSSLGALDAVLSRGVLMTADVQKVGSQLMVDEVPLSWDALWEGPADPLRYLESAAEKAASVSRLVGLAASGGLFTAGPLSLRGLLDPGAFLNALRHETAVAMGVPMDDLHLVSSWERSGIAGARVSLELSGLAIASAGFDGGSLSDVADDAPAATAIPNPTIAWVPKDSPRPYKHWLQVPIYIDGTRAQAVSSLQLPVPDESARRKWVLAGVALYLEG